MFNGGDPTGRITNIVWKSWGGHPGSWGRDWVVGGTEPDVAQGTLEAATIVAFNLGTCEGKFMYQAVEAGLPPAWRYLLPSQYENILPWHLRTKFVGDSGA